jgi:deazaflavin-dependent oxidoreductase (nitroreductase family)
MRFIRPFTTHVFNRFARRFAGWLPGFGILTHRGRKSGKTYHTPLNVFRRGDGYLFALTYGSDIDWVRNVLAAGEAELRTRRRDVHLIEPELFVDAKRGVMSQPFRLFLSIDNVTEFLRMRIA